MISKNGTFNQINVTPLTDVFLVLLVVMLIATPTFQRSVLKISAPSKGGEHSQIPDSKELIRIRINADGKVGINEKALADNSSKAIQRELEILQMHKTKSELQVKICPDPDTKQQNLVNALDAACGAGIKQVNIE